MFLPPLAPDPFDPGPRPLLMRHPTVSATTIAFAFAGDLWTVTRAGGEATRLTSSPGTESDPFFSPDGKWIAFTGQYDGNVDVYVIPAEGGVPKRLTAHPDADTAVGWSPDGRSVLFSSSMASLMEYPRLFSVPATGGIPKALPFPAGVAASLSPDGSRIAYVPNPKSQTAWKRYRGGQAAPIWVAEMKDSKWKPIPHGDEDLKCPMWIGNAVYYVSDPKGIMGLYRYDVVSGKVSETVKGEGFDIKSATAGPGCIAYEKLGSVWLYDLNKKTSKRINIDVKSDFPEVAPRLQDPPPHRLRPLPQRPAPRRHRPGPSLLRPRREGRRPRGQGGRRRRAQGSRLVPRRQDPRLPHRGERRPRVGPPRPRHGPGTACPPRRSPLDLPQPDVVPRRQADRLRRRPPERLDPRRRDRREHQSRHRHLRHGLRSPARLVARLQVARPRHGRHEPQRLRRPLRGRNRPQGHRHRRPRRRLLPRLRPRRQAPLLPRQHRPRRGRRRRHRLHRQAHSREQRLRGRPEEGRPNPLQPESDEETPADAKKPEPLKPSATTQIDPDGLEARTIALPIPAAVYRNLVPGPAGSFFLNGATGVTKFTFADRKPAPFASGTVADSTPDGAKLLLSGPGGMRIVPATAPPPPTGPAVDLSGLRTKIDPPTEWRKMYHAIWRNEKALFYDPKLHGADAALLEKRYEPFLPGLASREDLNYLISDMMGELSVGHMWSRGGDLPSGPPRVAGGLLGCDFEIVGGKYRLTRVYDGERWNPGLYAPLAQPGVEAKAGEYLLEIDGKPLDDALDLYEALEGKAGRQVRIKLGPTPDGANAREAVVLPVASERNLRFRAWGEDNRRRVLAATGGRVGYAHIPDTSAGGWTEFNRFYYAQQDKQGMIVDDRFNHGGYVADFLAREMTKTASYGTRTRYGKDSIIPATGVYGPKVMLINEMAGSGGDIFPDAFRLHRAGKIVGKRTWGAQLIAAGFSLVDGGAINAPNDALYDPIHGTWPIEGYGTPPDIEVEMDPYLWRQGKDAQLERAIAEILKDLASAKPVLQKKPDYPDKTKVRG